MKILNKYETQARDLSEIWNNTFEKYKISAHQLQSLILNFSAEYYIYVLIYKLFKPSLVIFNEQMATGKMAAAKKLGIKTIELQHGIMDEYYPQYLMHPLFKESKKELPFSGIIAVFGEFHKNQLLDKGFYNEDDIYVLGKFKMKRSLQPMKRFSDRKTILFITQTELLFEQAMKDLKVIVNQINFEEYLLIIKVHPLESSSFAASYGSFSENRPSQVKVIQKEYSVSQILPVVDYVIGYNSTVLLEAVYFNKPVFSLCDDYCLDGIFSIIGDDCKLKENIKVCKDIDGFIKALNDPYYPSKKDKSINNYLFEDNYENNCKVLIEQMVQD